MVVVALHGECSTLVLLFVLFPLHPALTHSAPFDMDLVFLSLTGYDCLTYLILV